jgi:hypothetical protein
MFPTKVRLMADANDRYVVSYHAGTRTLGTAVAEIAPGSGMQLRVVEAPYAALEHGVDSLHIRAQGDGSYSVGALEVLE